MAVRFEKVKHGNAVNGTVSQKYVAKIHSEGSIDFQQVAEKMIRAANLTEGVVYNVLSQLEDIIIECMKNGQSVKLGKLGTFYPALRARFTENKDEAGIKSIRKLECAFKPSKKIKNELKYTDFVLYKSKDV